MGIRGGGVGLQITTITFCSKATFVVTSGVMVVTALALFGCRARTIEVSHARISELVTPLDPFLLSETGNMKKFLMALIIGAFAMGTLAGCDDGAEEATETPADTSVAPGNSW